MTETSKTEAPTPDAYTGVVASTSRRLGIGWFSSRFAVIGIWILLAVLFSVLEPQTFATLGAWRAIFGGRLRN